jgi:hypothetical protein
MWAWANIDWDKSLTTSVAAATVVQTAVGVIMMNGLRHAGRQNRIANQTLQLAKETSERQLRAYVDVDRTTFTGFKSGEQVVVGVTIKNFGQTPARNVKTNLQIFIGKQSEVDALDALPVVETVSYTLPAGGEATVEARESAAFWTPHHQALKAGSLFLVAHGRVTYEDVFGAIRDVRLCYTCEDPTLHKSGERLMMSSCNNLAD